MSGTDVLALGETLWDLYQTGPDTFERHLGGAPTNLAVGLARLGVRVALVGAVGRDALGEALIERLRREGVGVSRMARLPERTGIAFVTRSPEGEPSFLFYRHETADMRLRREHVRGLPAARFAVAGTSTLLHDELRQATLRFARTAPLVVDLNVRAHLWKSARTMRARIAELVRLAVLVKGSRADVERLGPRFLAIHAKGATVVLTDGPRPATASGAHGFVEVPACPAACVDATGAGDAFLAGLLAVLVARRASPGTAAWRDPTVFTDALRVGHRLGAKVVSEVGAVTGLRDLADVSRMVLR